MKVRNDSFLTLEVRKASFTMSGPGDRRHTHGVDGTPCWADLAIGGSADEVTGFYEAVALAGGRRVAGIGAPGGSPPGWTL